MRIKPEIRERIEKAFQAAGFRTKLNFDITFTEFTAMGQTIPEKILEMCAITASINVPKEWIEW